MIGIGEAFPAPVGSMPSGCRCTIDSSEIFSARVCVGMLNSANAFSNCSSGQSALSNFNIIFRRCEKARLTTFTNER